MQDRRRGYLDAGSSTGSLLLIHPYRNYDKSAGNSGLWSPGQNKSDRRAAKSYMAVQCRAVLGVEIDERRLRRGAVHEVPMIARGRGHVPDEEWTCGVQVCW